jgi:hypothetical protein
MAARETAEPHALGDSANEGGSTGTGLLTVLLAVAMLVRRFHFEDATAGPLRERALGTLVPDPPARLRRQASNLDRTRNAAVSRRQSHAATRR